MTEHEIIRVRKMIKIMKHRHPFKWKQYKNHVSIVMYLMDAIDELDNLVHKDEYPVLHMSERESVNIIRQAGKIIQGVNLWKQSPLFHGFLASRVDDAVDCATKATYEYVQSMLNLVLADMNKSVVEYVTAIKDEMIRRSRKEFEENDMYDTDINIEFHDEDEESPEVEEKSSQFNTVIRLRNEATADRIVARTQIATLKSVLYYDYIDIIRGIDLISKMKQENREISNVLGKTTIKFVDIKSTKEDEKK